MREAIAVLNAGSSSLKFSLFELVQGELALVARGQAEGLTTRAKFTAADARGAAIAAHEWPAGQKVGHTTAARHLLGFIAREAAAHRLVAIGHRVVHGGADYSHPVRVDDGVLAVLERLVPLAPLHQPHNLAAIRALATEAPALPQVACFDTAFHRTQSPLATSFALPRAWTDSGVQRYGFHGLSYEFVAGVLPSVDANAAQGKVVVAHLGNGASMCALEGGRSVATTMGMTALDGLVMGTRAGTLDPGVLLYLQRSGLDASALERLLYHESGLLGVSGVSSDMRTLLASPDPNAKFAIDLFCYRASRELGSMAGALGGLDALVFTGGIGEHAAPVRARILDRIEWLGFTLDPAANARNAMCITTADSAKSCYVIPTNEELVIARHTCAMINR